MLTLRALEAEGFVRVWHDRMILPGQEWDTIIRERLESSELILFLVSPSFLESGYCRRVEMELALEMETQKKAHVIPLILSECNWQKESFARLLALPNDGKPIFKGNGAANPNRLQQVVDGLRFALLGLWSSSQTEDPYGATIQSLASLVSVAEKDDSTQSIELLAPSRSYTPLLMNGLRVSEDGKGLGFLVDSGQSGFEIGSQEYQNEVRKVMDYFWECLGIKAELQWVNLSPFGNRRMLSEELAGTRLGHDLLSFDYNLKIFSASLLHPDTDSGKSYWKELYQRLKSGIGTTNVPIRSHHTITIMPAIAQIYETSKPVDPIDSKNSLDGFLAGAFLCAGVVSENKLIAVCSTGEEAISHMPLAGSTGQNRSRNEVIVTELATNVFRETILPIIERELNEGELFSENRQIFQCMILSTWLKVKAETEGLIRDHFDCYLDKNHPDSSKFLIKSITPLSSVPTKAAAKANDLLSDRITSSDPAFRIAENAEFYERYLRLFRGGLYRTVRIEDGDIPGQKIGRVYFSGAANYSTLYAGLKISNPV